MEPDRLQMVVDAITGLSVDDVQALIEGSVNAAEVEDPAKLAAYLVSLAG